MKTVEFILYCWCGYYLLELYYFKATELLKSLNANHFDMKKFMLQNTLFSNTSSVTS